MQPQNHKIISKDAFIIHHDNYKPIAESIQQDQIALNPKSSKNKHIHRLKSKFITYQKHNSKQSSKNNNKNNGHWSLQQNQRYFMFLNAHKHQFQQKNLRRTQRIFKFMSDFMKTRSASQCRSHHQKMQKKCESFQRILDYLMIVCKYEECGQIRINEEWKYIQNDEYEQICLSVNEEQNVYNQEVEEIISYEMPKYLQPCYQIRWKYDRESTGYENS